MTDATLATPGSAAPAQEYPTLAEAYKIAALDAWNRMPRKQPSVAAHDDAMAALERFAKAARRAASPGGASDRPWERNLKYRPEPPVTMAIFPRA